MKNLFRFFLPVILIMLGAHACAQGTFSRISTQINPTESPTPTPVEIVSVTLAAESIPNAQGSIVYTAKTGDTLQAIADAFRVSINDLLRINGLPLDAEVSPGQQIKIPLNQAAAPTQVCDQAAFIGDVTVPDGTIFSSGEAFTKTWRVQNIGTCTWNTGYSLAIARPPQIEGPGSVPLTTQPVAAGQTVDVSINLVAPQAPGKFTNYYALVNDSGQVIAGKGNIFLTAVIQVEGSVAKNITPAPTQSVVIASLTQPATNLPQRTSQPGLTPAPTAFSGAVAATSPPPAQTNPTQAPATGKPQPTSAAEPDTDTDGIPDRIEDWLAKTYMPYFIVDEEEPNPLGMRWIYQVTPVFYNGKPQWVVFIITILTETDYAPVDFPEGERDVFWHDGDSESIRIFFRWRPVLKPVSYYDGEYIPEHITIRRHKRAHEYSASDFHATAGTHPWIFVSEGKHAMYPSAYECERSDI